MRSSELYCNYFMLLTVCVSAAYCCGELNTACLYTMCIIDYADPTLHIEDVIMQNVCLVLFSITNS